jgi:multimeric flavodoxin WrbA
MKILGFLGSPRVDGHCARLVTKALEGAESAGAKTKMFELINYDIKDCKGCCNCFLKNPDLPIGKCIIKDDMAAILEEYIEADGYILASPVYDMFITALMKRFLERKIALTYRNPPNEKRLPGPRRPAHFIKKASLIVTGFSNDEYADAMGGPCFDAMQTHFMIEQVDIVDQLYVGDVEFMTEENFVAKFDTAYRFGSHLAAEIEKDLKEGGK